MGLLKSLISSQKFPFLFYSAWFFLALWQAKYTELLSDEAYYWKYSQFLEWGYFDHPPMVALLAKIGTSLMPGELGVRLLFVLLGTSTIYLIQSLINPANKTLFYVIITSIGFLYFTSFLALPDVPLLFFTALFFLLLKRYFEKNSWLIAICLGLTIGCLLLSKYHGFLIIIFALIGSVKLLKRGSFYIIIVIAILVVIPHFIWQLNNHFPSIQYHFHDRNLDAYSIGNTINYVLVQLLLFGPFVGIFLWIGFFRSGPKNQLEKVLFWQVIGIFSFFFLLTFNGRVQGHWTSIMLIPLVYFGYNFLSKNLAYRKWIYYQWPITILIIVVVKAGLVFDLPFGEKFNRIFKDFKGKSTWAKSIHKTTKNTPLVFMNSYQNASVYEFYTGQLAITISNVMSRKNQYDLWRYEDTLRGKTVNIVPNYSVDGFDILPEVIPFTQIKTVHNFQHYGQIELTAKNWTSIHAKGEDLPLVLSLQNSGSFNFIENSDYPSVITYTYFEDNHFIGQYRTHVKLNTIEKEDFKIILKTPDIKSTYQVYFSIQTGWLPPSLNSRVYELTLN